MAKPHEKLAAAASLDALINMMQATQRYKYKLWNYRLMTHINNR